jgi:hypothetical protein
MVWGNKYWSAGFELLRRYYRGCCYLNEKKPPLREGFMFQSTRGRDRTGTVLLPLVFETSASTNSATRALHVVLRNAKICKKNGSEK